MGLKKTGFRFGAVAAVILAVLVLAAAARPSSIPTTPEPASRN